MTSPLPWKASKYGVVDAIGNVVARPAADNADLIAAAPTLLAACNQAEKALARHFDDPVVVNAWQAVHDAVIRAEVGL